MNALIKWFVGLFCSPPASSKVQGWHTKTCVSESIVIPLPKEKEISTRLVEGICLQCIRAVLSMDGFCRDCGGKLVMPRVNCPECGAGMALRQTHRYQYKDGSPKKFFGCSRFPRCKGMHAANKNGKPIGRPADDETKLFRQQAHRAFDKIWLHEDGLSREQAYKTLGNQLGIVPEKCHIGSFDIPMCRKVIGLYK